MVDDEFIYRFEYADGSAFEIFVNGKAEIVFKNGRREQKYGTVINRIPQFMIKSYPSKEAMKSALELEILSCLGQVTTKRIGELIQIAIDESKNNE